WAKVDPRSKTATAANNAVAIASFIGASEVDCRLPGVHQVVASTSRLVQSGTASEQKIWLRGLLDRRSASTLCLTQVELPDRDREGRACRRGRQCPSHRAC